MQNSQAQKDPNSNIITSLPITSIGTQTAYQYNIRANDPEDGYLSYSLSTAPEGMTINALVVVVVTDEAGATAEQAFSINASSNNPPDIHSSSIRTSLVNTQHSYAVYASDIDGNEFHYTLLVAPANATVSTDGVITWTPSATGDFDFTVQVTDREAFINQSWTVSVSEEADLTAKVEMLNTLLDVDQPATVQVQFENAIGAVTTSLAVDGEPVELDANHTAALTFAPCSCAIPAT